ncbi:MAG: alpha/beta fold hydrolase [Lysobacterales bacterium]
MSLPRASHPHINFRRRGPLANAHVQSLLASSGLRRAAARLRFPGLHEASTEVILDCGEGVRLQGYHSVQSALPRARGLVVLLHGWEGSVQSSYLLVSAGRLLAAGFDVFRLHFRDHGDTHHLNEGLFHSCRLDEVVNAVAAVRARYAPRRLLIAGFSLGGNFALRVALKAPALGLDLAYAFAVCPPIDPAGSLRQIEVAPWMYERYFIAKWTDSLRRKQALFPERYDFSEWLKKPTLRDLTARMVEAYTDFPSLDDYLRGYSVAGDRLSALQVPATVVTANDDPVIPIGDYLELTVAPATELILAEHGGHCGFIEDWRLKSWIEDLLVERLTQAAGGD